MHLNANANACTNAFKCNIQMPCLNNVDIIECAVSLRKTESGIIEVDLDVPFISVKQCLHFATNDPVISDGRSKWSNTMDLLAAGILTNSHYYISTLMMPGMWHAAYIS